MAEEAALVADVAALVADVEAALAEPEAAVALAAASSATTCACAVNSWINRASLEESAIASPEPPAPRYIDIQTP